jgi:hypothetical protein
MKYKTMWLAILFFASGCAASSARPDFCAVYRAVPTLACGTETQQLAVDQNNAVYMRLCLKR